MTKTYLCADHTFNTLAEACEYAQFVFKISGLVVAITIKE